MNNLPNRQQVRNTIKFWFRMFNPGDKLTTTNVVKHVHKYVSKSIDSETIKRELRYMRKDGIINYKHIGKKSEKIIQII